MLLPVLLSWCGHVICGAVTCDVASCTFLHLKRRCGLLVAVGWHSAWGLRGSIGNAWLHNLPSCWMLACELQKEEKQYGTLATCHLTIWLFDFKLRSRPKLLGSHNQTLIPCGVGMRTACYCEGPHTYLMGSNWVPTWQPYHCFHHLLKQWGGTFFVVAFPH